MDQSSELRETLKKVKELKSVNVTPDDIQFKHQVRLSDDRADVSIVNSSNGYSKITTFSLSSLRKLEKDLEEIKQSEEEAADIEEKNHLEVQIAGLSTSVICRNARGVRKEIALLHLEAIHFCSISTKESQELQLQIGYA